MDEQKTEERNRKKKRAMLVAASAFLIGGMAVGIYLYYKAYHISTDDAFIESQVYTISSRVSGTVESVLVQDNQRVGRGDVLLTIDQKDYRLRVRAEEAALETARARLKELGASVEIQKLSLSEAENIMEGARANLELKQSVLRKAEQDRQRAETLFQKEVISRESFDSAATAHDVAKADARAASEKLLQAEQAMEIQRARVSQTALEAETQNAKIDQEEVALNAAQLSLSYTAITAPGDGYVTRKGVEPGNFINIGQPLMALVDLDDFWITANFKETELGRISAGQRVRFSVDAWPGVIFNGTVHSIMAGTGSAFSVFPAENATGNYVKVVQRVPVKIVPDKGAFDDHKPRAGMSVVPVVFVR